MTDRKGGFGCNFDTCFKVFVCCYICNQCFKPPARGTGMIYALAGFAENASGDEVNQAIVPAATGGALGDIPFLACANMSRDEASGAQTEASLGAHDAWDLVGHC